MNKILLLGPARSGKTHHVLSSFEQALRSQGDPLAADFFFVVPSAEHTERVVSRIVRQGVPGFFHRRVTTFSRLIRRFFASADTPVASSVTRYLLLRRIFELNDWPFFAGVRESPGFLNALLAFLSELKESLVPVSVFRERMNGLKRLEPDLAPKYEALAGVYEAYEAALAASGLKDRQDGLAEYLAGKKNRPLRLKFKRIWLDGFFDFSEWQMAYLCELAEWTEEITVTLTLDPEPGRYGLFEAAQATRARLKAAGFEEKILTRSPQGRVSGTLDFAERHLFSVSPLSRKAGPGGDVTVFEAVGVEGEIEMIARSILGLCRQGDYRFSDFAVLLRRIGDYEGVIRSVFSRYGIPVEVHERERLSFSPVIRPAVHLMRIFRHGWRRADVLEFLKSSYVRRLAEEANDYEWAGRLEHDAMARGIFEGREAWLAPRAALPDGERAFEEEKAKRLGILALLEDRLRAARSVTEIKNIFLQAAQKTFGIFEYRPEAREYARRDAAGYARFRALLDEIETSSRPGGGDEGLIPGAGLDHFADRFLGLVDLDLYALHERDRNRVQVYSVSLARQKEYRVVYIAGLLEKKFPAEVREDPVLSDWERQHFNGMGGGPGLKERLPRQSLERYLFYLAVTRASEKIFLTYPRLDLEGRESLPSYYVEEVRNLFDGPVAFKRQDLGRPYPAPAEAVNARELELGVMGALWNPGENSRAREPLFLCLLNSLLAREDVRQKFKRAFYEVRDELTDPAIHGLYPFRPFKTSATAVEEYAKCPFHYYARRVLKLADPEEDANVFNRGILLHGVLETCFREWCRDPSLAKEPDKAVEEAFDRLSLAFAEHPIFREKKYQTDLEYEGLRETLGHFLGQELARLKTSPLRPRYFEFDFGGRDSAVPPWVIRDRQREIALRGKIDRVDTDEASRAGLVLDYKRSAVFKRGDLELGVSLQLPVYASVIRELLGLEPIAAELYSLVGCEKKGFYREAYLHCFPGLSRRRMILDDPAFESVLERGVWFVKKFSTEMEALKIPVRPRVCYENCPYAPVCRIEKWRLPLILEELKEESLKLYETDGHPAKGR